MVMYETSKYDRNAHSSHRDRRDRSRSRSKHRDDKKHHKHSDRRRHDSRDRNRIRKHESYYTDKRGRNYDEKYMKSNNDKIDSYKRKKSDFVEFSDHNRKTKHKKHKREKSIELPSDNEGYLSDESKDMEDLELLRKRRQKLIEEIRNQEMSAKSVTNSIGTPEDIKFDFNTAQNENSSGNVSFENSKEERSIDSPNKETNKPACIQQDESQEKEVIFDMFRDNLDNTLMMKLASESVIKNVVMLDETTDEEGYYIIRLGEMFDNRYSVFATTGSGVFSNVVKAKDSQNNNQEVAIKIIRNNDMMHRVGLKEIEYLKVLNDMDKNDKFHCVRLLRHFTHKKHLCLVFESLEMNLRDVLKKYGRNKGLNIAVIRSYAHQLLLSLKLIKKAELIHADIKPDNILVNENKSLLKLSDFGSVCRFHENDITENLVSRFYRAPEIILGMKYDYNVDLWSVGTTLFELYTGHVMFPGKDNNEMLKLMMDIKGRFPKSMLKKATFRSKYFDDQNNFLSKEFYKVTETERTKLIRPPESRPLSLDLFFKYHTVPVNDPNYSKIRQFRDFLDKILELSPQRRISINDALNHPFITESLK